MGILKRILKGIMSLYRNFKWGFCMGNLVGILVGVSVRRF